MQIPISIRILIVIIKYFAFYALLMFFVNHKAGVIVCSADDQNLKVIISFDSYDYEIGVFFQRSARSNLRRIVEMRPQWHFVLCSTSHIVNDVLQCKDGVWECQMDVLHACAAHCYESQECDLGNFFICTMTDDAQFLKGKACAEQSGLCWETLRKCKPSEQAGTFCDNRYNQLTKFGEKVVPGVMFNWKYDVKTEADAIENLKDTICARLKTMGKTCAACSSCGGENGH